MKSKRVWSTVSILIFMIVIIAGVRLLMGPSLFTPWQLPKVWVAIGLALLGTVLLMTQKLNAATRIVLMVVAFFAFGVVSVLPLGDFARGMGLHPSPMCVIEKPFLFVNAGRTIPIIFISIFAFVGILTVVSNKSFCG